MPIHHLSFFKAPKKVIKEIIAIQRRFLWAGTCDKGGMAWDRWSLVCKPKDVGGLGIKHVGAFNLALLTKWLWKITYEPNAIWSKIFEAKYGNVKSKTLAKQVQGVTRLESLWWNDIMIIGDSIKPEGFVNQLPWKLGDGGTFFFWFSPWLGSLNLEELVS
ncbi:unnamed protein product [Lathyrus sativus]|nr:unnamed protein product [Lathyrus sativus]